MRLNVRVIAPIIVQLRNRETVLLEYNFVEELLAQGKMQQFLPLSAALIVPQVS